jgi:dienelactone hydrolase
MWQHGEGGATARLAVGVLLAILTLGVLVTPAVAWRTETASASPATGDAFYSPPDPLPHGAPGAVIRTMSIAAPAGARAWKVLYHSRALDGRDLAVSGVVVAPDARAPAGGRPIVTWAHGTTGLADQCAPSRIDTVGTTLPFEQQFLDAGYVVAATDYEGLGTPGPHPYLVGESEGRSVLDIARAAHGLGAGSAGTGAGKTVVVAGHSQGGQAALFAGQLAPTYAPELRVKGVAAFAPATEPATFLAAAALVPATRGFAAMIAEGIGAAFPNADVDAVLTPDAAAAVQQLDGAGCLFTTLAGFRDRDITVLRGDPNAVPAIHAALLRSTPGRVATKIPTFVLQGDADQLVPEPSTQAYVTRACALGDPLTYTVYAGATHSGVLIAGSTDFLHWIADRLAARGAASGAGQSTTSTAGNSNCSPGASGK